MANRTLERIWLAVIEHRYALTEHAVDEMNADRLDVLDVESAILTGQMNKTLTHDPRGARYAIRGQATDQKTRVEVVVRFVDDKSLLVLTVYEVK